MKKYLAVAGIAAASLAAAVPSTASAATAGAGVACNDPLVQCAEELAYWALDQADPAKVVEAVFDAIEDGGDLVDEVCDRVLGTCNDLTP